MDGANNQGWFGSPEDREEIDETATAADLLLLDEG